MDPIQQPQQQPPMTEPVLSLKKHHSALGIALVLAVVAVVLFLIIGATGKSLDDTDMTAAEQDAMMFSEPVLGAGESPEATAEESAAIRSDLEAESFDGVSEGI